MTKKENQHLKFLDSHGISITGVTVLDDKSSPEAWHELDKKIEYFSAHGFKSIAKDLNLERNLISGGQLFSEIDFDGSTLFPDSTFLETFTKKHSLSPLSLGLIVPLEKWSGLISKFNI